MSKTKTKESKRNTKQTKERNVYCIKPYNNKGGYCANAVLVEAANEDQAMEEVIKTHALARFDNWSFHHVNSSHVTSKEHFFKNPI